MSRCQAFRLAVPSAASDSPARFVNGLVDLPDVPGKRPTVVVIHGFKGFMEWGFFPPLADLLRERGFAVVRFNVSGSGMEPGEDRATDLQGFTDNTFSRELEDVDAVLQAVIDGTLPGGDRMDGDRLGLLGHSRGGGAAVLTAGSERWRERLRALVTWASLATYDRVSDDDKARWRRDGGLPVVNSRTNQVMTLGLGLLEDLEAHPERLDIVAAAGRVTAPWLIVHGTDDEAVSVEDGRTLHGAAGGSATVELHELAGAGHTFGAGHPFTGPTPDLVEVFNGTQTWFRRHLCD